MIISAIPKGRLNAQKDRGLDGLLRTYSLSPLEENKKIIVNGTNKLERMYNKYDSFLNIKYYALSDEEKTCFVRNPHFRFYGVCIADVLSPAEINIFAQSRLINDRSSHAGLFLSKLIQNSYAAGYNDFQITLGCPILFPNYLEGKKNNLLKIVIEEGIGNGGEHLTFVDLTVSGRCKSIGNWTSYSSITAHGDVAEYSCYQACDSIFTFHGKVCLDDGYGPPYTSYAEQSQRCVFKTSDLETLQHFVKKIDANGHKIFFIHPDGREELKREDHG